MAIERKDDIFTVFCDADGCLNFADFETDGDFNLLLEAMKEEGWRSTKQSGDWENICPDCVQKEKDELNQTLAELPQMEGLFFGNKAAASKRNS